MKKQLTIISLCLAVVLLCSACGKMGTSTAPDSTQPESEVTAAQKGVEGDGENVDKTSKDDMQTFAQEFLDKFLAGDPDCVNYTLKDEAGTSETHAELHRELNFIFTNEYSKDDLELLFFGTQGMTLTAQPLSDDDPPEVGKSYPIKVVGKCKAWDSTLLYTVFTNETANGAQFSLNGLDQKEIYMPLLEKTAALMPETELNLELNCVLLEDGSYALNTMGFLSWLDIRELADTERVAGLCNQYSTNAYAVAVNTSELPPDLKVLTEVLEQFNSGDYNFRAMSDKLLTICSQEDDKEDILDYNEDIAWFEGLGQADKDKCIALLKEWGPVSHMPYSVYSSYDKLVETQIAILFRFQTEYNDFNPTYQNDIIPQNSGWLFGKYLLNYVGHLRDLI